MKVTESRESYNIYANCIKDTLSLLLEEFTLLTRQTKCYQHDGCPAHYSLIARRELDETFRNRWIGRGGPIFNRRSFLDFFLWGTLKEKVYKVLSTTPYDMQERIIAVCVSRSSDAVRLAGQSIVKRLQWCIDSDGHHFEHQL